MNPHDEQDKQLVMNQMWIGAQLMPANLNSVANLQTDLDVKVEKRPEKVDTWLKKHILKLKYRTGKEWCTLFVKLNY